MSKTDQYQYQRILKTPAYISHLFEDLFLFIYSSVLYVRVNFPPVSLVKYAFTIINYL